MKKAVSILLAFLVLITTIHFSIATHYCGGKIAAVKYSLTGEKASCGMEKDTASCSYKNSVSSHCCSDQLTIVSTDQNYISYFSVYKIVQNAFQLFALPLAELRSQPGISHSIQNFLSRQSVFRASGVLLDFICVFRI